PRRPPASRSPSTALRRAARSATRSPTISPPSSRSPCWDCGRCRGCIYGSASCGPPTESDVTAPSGVRVAAHAKVNLFLRILARDGAGWHQLETALALLELADELEARRSDAGVTLHVDGPDLGPVEDNLAVRAARAVLEATGSRFGVALRLTKRIPARAGLGGGSSDAAAA